MDFQTSTLDGVEKMTICMEGKLLRSFKYLDEWISRHFSRLSDIRGTNLVHEMIYKVNKMLFSMMSSIK